MVSKLILGNFVFIFTSDNIFLLISIELVKIGRFRFLSTEFENFKFKKLIFSGKLKGFLSNCRRLGDLKSKNLGNLLLSLGLGIIDSRSILIN